MKIYIFGKSAVRSSSLKNFANGKEDVGQVARIWKSVYKHASSTCEKQIKCGILAVCVDNWQIPASG